jgi:tyrosyl-tRNA synthetase
VVFLFIPMAINFVEELRSRGMLQDITPGLEESLEKECITGYVGFDPTAESLHLGNFATIVLLMHLQRAGHKPIALVGGATGMIGDPSGKSAERNLLDTEAINRNTEAIRKQLEKFLDFSEGPTKAEVVNNLDWFGAMSAIDFLRNIGKHLSLNYMMAKDSVQKRLETGISFTEFSYQLLQGYDFRWLFEHKNCRLQMGGSDQWGNITAGTELIRRMGGEQDAFALTTPLVTKSDGTKFGKSESGALWLDSSLTSPYQLYQFLLNTGDDEAPMLLRRLTFVPMEEILTLEVQHNLDPSQRLAQKKLAAELTRMIHGEEGFQSARLTTEVLFGKGAIEELETISEAQFQQVVQGIPRGEVLLNRNEPDWTTALSADCSNLVFPSKTEARKMLQAGAVQVNKVKVAESGLADWKPLREKWLLIQKGKKNYFLLEIK